MQRIDYQPTPEHLGAAKTFSEFRQQCKQFLTARGAGFDKFTMVAHDSYVGYITERVIRDHLLASFAECIHSVKAWDEQFDLERIGRIIEQTEPSDRELRYVREYFYDGWDLAITCGKGTIYADVKTALTEKQPRAHWNFLYPAVQVRKPGKDLMILVYYVWNGRNLEGLDRLVLVGATTPAQVRTRKEIRKGERTQFGTLSQIDNFETEMGDYQPLQEFLC